MSPWESHLGSVGREVSRKRKQRHWQYEAWGAAGVGCGLRVQVRSGAAGVPPGWGPGTPRHLGVQ